MVWNVLYRWLFFQDDDVINYIVVDVQVHWIIWNNDEIIAFTNLPKTTRIKITPQLISKCVVSSSSCLVVGENSSETCLRYETIDICQICIVWYFTRKCCLYLSMHIEYITSFTVKYIFFLPADVNPRRHWRAIRWQPRVLRKWEMTDSMSFSWVSTNKDHRQMVVLHRIAA